MTHIKAPQILTPVRVILAEGHVIPVDNIAFAGPVHIRNGSGMAYLIAQQDTAPAYRVRLRSEGHIDLHSTTAEGFAALLAGDPF